MNPVFRNHIVICGWNRRAARVVSNLQALSKRPILIVHSDIDRSLADVGRRPGILIMRGDCSSREVLEKADVAQAYSVLVLALDELGDSADARSVQIALAVERIRTAVYTVVELRDIQNKSHFAWTKVDDLVTDQEIAVRVIAQAVRHIVQDDGSEDREERSLLGLYQQLIDPLHSGSQIYRVDLEWELVKHYTFEAIFKLGVTLGVLPLAPVGFRRHRQPETGGDEHAWVSWKGHVLSSPPKGIALSKIWGEWPSELSPLGILVLAKSREEAQRLAAALLKTSVAA